MQVLRIPFCGVAAHNVLPLLETVLYHSSTLQHVELPRFLFLAQSVCDAASRFHRALAVACHAHRIGITTRCRRRLPTMVARAWVDASHRQGDRLLLPGTGPSSRPGPKHVSDDGAPQRSRLRGMRRGGRPKASQEAQRLLAAPHPEYLTYYPMIQSYSAVVDCRRH